MCSYTHSARGAHSRPFQTTGLEISQKSDTMPWGKHTMSFNFPLFHPAISPSLPRCPLLVLLQTHFFSYFQPIPSFRHIYKFSPPCGDDKHAISFSLMCLLFHFLLLSSISDTVRHIMPFSIQNYIQYNCKAAWHMSDDRHTLNEHDTPYKVHKV